MSVQLQVRIVELGDRYLVVSDDTGENVDDDLGFSCRHAAVEWAEMMDYEVVNK